MSFCTSATVAAKNAVNIPIVATMFSATWEYSNIGEIINEDGCECGTKGKCFLVHGRAAKSEIRGCSDT